MKYAYLVETLDKGTKCDINGCNVRAYSSSLNAVKSFPAGTKFDWLDNTAMILSAEFGDHIGWCSKVALN